MCAVFKKDVIKEMTIRDQLDIQKNKEQYQQGAQLLHEIVEAEQKIEDKVDNIND